MCAFQGFGAKGSEEWQIVIWQEAKGINAGGCWPVANWGCSLRIAH